MNIQSDYQHRRSSANLQRRNTDESSILVCSVKVQMYHIGVPCVVCAGGWSACNRGSDPIRMRNTTQTTGNVDIILNNIKHELSAHRRLQPGHNMMPAHIIARICQMLWQNLTIFGTYKRQFVTNTLMQKYILFELKQLAPALGRLTLPKTPSATCRANISLSSSPWCGHQAVWTWTL